MVALEADRWNYLALGGASLLCAISGVIVPGIPSAPFFVISAHYFARSSTTFRRWIEKMPRLAELLRRIEDSEAMVLNRGTLLCALGMALLLGLLFLVIHPPLPLVIAIELALTAFFGLRQIGELDLFSEGISQVFA